MDFSIKFDTLPSGRPELVIGFGVFDGVHPGHRLIMANVVEIAAGRSAIPAAITFSPHPRAVIPGMQAPAAIISLEKRIARLRQCGAAVTGIIDFTPEFGAMEPEEFLDSLLRRQDFRIGGICVGEDWRFGRGGKGDAAMLKLFADANGLGFRAVKRLEYKNINISSSIIRELIAAGKLEEAEEISGSTPELCGIVRRGFRIAGRELNAPTANLELTAGVMVPDGVYAGKCELENRVYAAVLNIGLSPTYGGNERRIEVHLLDFNGDLYGLELTVQLLKFLRPERKFNDPSELKEQITRDIAEATVIFNDKTRSN
ncbi:MAG: riboflavin biosynthesis protein RibF [Lentisphaeria bacterium]|nr:riboflavin biosynthesis protein RibF [Lentisphaeria bacterium]